MKIGKNNTKKYSKEPKLPFGVHNVHLIHPDKEFSQLIYKKEFAPKTLEVRFKYDPQSPTTGRECKNVSFLIKIYGHDTKSKGKRVSNEISIPFYETKRIWIFAESWRRGQLVDDYIKFYIDEYCSDGISESEKLELSRKEAERITNEFENSIAPIRLNTYFPFSQTEMEEEKEYTLHTTQLHYLPMFNGEKAKKPWLFSIDRWIGTYYGMLDGEPVILGDTDQRTEIRMTENDFLEFTAVIQNAVGRWQNDAFVLGERIPCELEYIFR